MMTCELFILTYDVNWLTQYFTWRTVGELILLQRELLVAFSIAIAQLGPLYFPPAYIDQRTLKQCVKQLEKSLNTSSTVADSASEQLLKPFVQDLNMVGRLRQKIEQTGVECSILENNTELKDLYVNLKNKRMANETNNSKARP